jgi:acetolactate synthase-1/3 small subunit
MDDSYIIQKIGTESDINLLYNQLDGKHLLSFCRGGLINNHSLIPLDGLFVS